MSVLSDMQAERGIPAIQEVAGGNAVHTRRDKSTQTFIAPVDEMPGGQLQDDREGRHVDLVAVLILPLTDIAGAPANIDSQGWFLANGTTWNIASLQSSNGATIVHLRRKNLMKTATIRK